MNIFTPSKLERDCIAVIRPVPVLVVLEELVFLRSLLVWLVLISLAATLEVFSAANLPYLVIPYLAGVLLPCLVTLL